MANVILRLPAVMKRTGLSRSSVYLWIAKGQFPAPVSLGARAVGWVESEVEEWIARRIAQSRKEGTGHQPRP
jgi:prophage regulatory protein